MIGSMPRYVPRIHKMPARLYKRVRRRQLAKAEVSLFDHRPAEFPMATITPTDGQIGRAHV